jgi:hypothetical protein
MAKKKFGMKQRPPPHSLNKVLALNNVLVMFSQAR